ncbi:MAG: sigma-54 dependent transcriptional regulator [Desulfobacteraceae bacterium]|jgi:DNA-binding NtrC family response regulator
MNKKEFKVKGTAEPQTAHHALKRNTEGMMGGFIIIGLPHGAKIDDLELVEHIKRHSKNSPIVMLAGDNSESQIEAALKIGMSDFFKWPCQAKTILERFKIRMHENLLEPSSDYSESDGFVTGKSPLMKKIKDYLKKIAVTDSNVLLTGETGTGKDIAAEYIHKNSIRKIRPLLCVNCTAFPETLLESELFGYEKGAFTSAMTARPGKFEMASGGTLFLDEIGDMGMSAQAKILRAIEKKEIWRIGGDKPYLSDFRLITATNRNPEHLIDTGQFREDLYYRLNIARVHLPPLRDRREDIEELTHYAIGVLNRKLNTRIRGVSSEVKTLFHTYDWPGNVRQLNNVIEASFINSPLHIITYHDLPESFRMHFYSKNQNHNGECDELQRVLLETGWNISKAAEKMSVSRMTLYRKMNKYRITR